MSSIVPFQEGWRLCNKCTSLVFNPTDSKEIGSCVLPQYHETGSRHFQVYFQSRSFKGQTGWRWCWKCEALFFNGHSTKGVCPSDKGWHDGSESGKYELLHADVNSPLPFYDWKWCVNCEQIFVPDVGMNACPKGDRHDAWGTNVSPVYSGYYYIEESLSSKEPNYAELDMNSIPKVPKWI